MKVFDAMETFPKAGLCLEIGIPRDTSLVCRERCFVEVNPTFKLVGPIGCTGRQTHLPQLNADDFAESGFLTKLILTPRLASIAPYLYGIARKKICSSEKIMEKFGRAVFHGFLSGNVGTTCRIYVRHRSWTGNIPKTILVHLKTHPCRWIDVISVAKTGLRRLGRLSCHTAPPMAFHDEAVQRYNVPEKDLGVATDLSKTTRMRPKASFFSLKVRS